MHDVPEKFPDNVKVEKLEEVPVKAPVNETALNAALFPVKVPVRLELPFTVRFTPTFSDLFIAAPPKTTIDPVVEEVESVEFLNTY